MTAVEMILAGVIIGLIICAGAILGLMICVIVIGDQVQAIKAKRK